MTIDRFELFGRDWVIFDNHYFPGYDLMQDNGALEYAGHFEGKINSIEEIGESDLEIKTAKGNFILCNAAFAPKNWVLIKSTGVMFGPTTCDKKYNPDHFDIWNGSKHQWECDICGPLLKQGEHHKKSVPLVYQGFDLPNKPPCNHIWAVYTGMKETFTYCTKCDQKQT